MRGAGRALRPGRRPDAPGRRLARGEPLHTAPLEDWALLHDLLIRTVQHTTRAFHDALVASEHGRFVLVSAKQAQAPSNTNAAYAAAKAAAEAWTLALADGFAGTGATANIVVVEAILTQRMREESPGKEFPTFTPAEHIADAIAFLCSDGAAEMNGQRLLLTMRIDGESKPADGEMTIRELAERTGMTVRNIRAHQTRGLLPPPVVRGRTGYYNEEHVVRIELTREMQADGLNLEAIRRVLESGDGSAAAISDFTRHCGRPFEDEAPEIVEGGEIAGTLGRRRDPERRERAEKIGIIRTLPDGRIEVISPSMLRAGGRAGRARDRPGGGAGGRGEAETPRRRLRPRLRRPLLEELWGPFEEAGHPEHDWQRMSEALERLRPLAAGTVLAMFKIAMGEAVEKESERTLQASAPNASRRSAGARPEFADGGPGAAAERERIISGL